METHTLKAKDRKEIGTRACRDIRTQGRVPAIIYGHGEAPESITLGEHDVAMALQHGARSLQVDLKGAVGSYLIKEVQYGHLQIKPIHLDLARVDLSERVTVKVGIELRGTPKGVASGGVLDQFISDIEVECAVTDIPGTLHPLVTEMEIGDSLLVKDLDFPPGVTPLAGPEDRVAHVRELAAEAADAEAGDGEPATSAEPERIGRVRKDDEAAAGEAKS
jgi:large subunit ribosomal protein L25